MEEATKVNLKNTVIAWVIPLGIAFSFFGPAHLLADVSSVELKVKNLSLQRDRIQATKLLRSSIKDPKYSKSDGAKLKAMLAKVSRTFYSAKALQDFEKARSTLVKDQLRSFDLFEQAHKAEPLNIKPLKRLASENLKLSKCSESRTWSNRALEVDPYNQEAIQLNLLALGCLGEVSDLLEMAELNESILEEDYFHLASAQAHLLDRNLLDTEVSLGKIRDKELPERYYFEGLLRKSRGLDSYKVSLARYVGLCRDLEAVRKRFPNDPRLCGERDSVVEKFQLPSGGSIQKVVK